MLHEKCICAIYAAWSRHIRIQHLCITVMGRRIRLHANPPRHPKLSDLLGLIHKPHIQKQLRSPSDRTLQSTKDPRMRIACMLAHKHRMLLRLEVRRQIQSLLQRGGRSPSTGLVLIVHPALSVVGACVLLSGDGAVELDHGALDVGDVVFFGHCAGGFGHVAGQVGGEDYTWPAAVELVGWIADTSDS